MHPRQQAEIDEIERALLAAIAEHPGGYHFAVSGAAQQVRRKWQAKVSASQLERPPSQSVVGFSQAFRSANYRKAHAVGAIFAVWRPEDSDVDALISQTRNFFIHVVTRDDVCVTIEHTDGQRHLIDSPSREDREIDALCRFLQLRTPEPSLPPVAGIVLLWGRKVHLAARREPVEPDDLRRELQSAVETVLGHQPPTALPDDATPRMASAWLDALTSEVMWNHVMGAVHANDPTVKVLDAGAYSRSPLVYVNVDEQFFRVPDFTEDAAAWAREFSGRYFA